MNPTQRALARTLVTAALAVTLAGCGKTGPYPVEGVVVWEDGAPAKELANGQVIFDLPEKSTGAKGTIQADGSFKLTTTTPNDGALPGTYKVMVLEGGRKPLPGGDGSMLAPTAMDIKYSDPNTTDLTATVEATKLNKITLKVKRNTKK